MTAALEGGEWSAPPPGRTLPPGKTRYPLYRRLGGSQGRSGRAENLVPTRIRSRTVQPVVSRSVYGTNGIFGKCAIIRKFSKYLSEKFLTCIVLTHSVLLQSFHMAHSSVWLAVLSVHLMMRDFRLPPRSR